MNWHAAGLRRLDGIIWVIIAAVAFTVMAATTMSGFRLLWASFLAPLAAVVVCLIGQRFYQTRRPDHRLAAALGCTAQLIAFAAVGAPLSYIGASFDLPLLDRWFDNADSTFGLDWFSLLSWMDAHPMFHPLFSFSYKSLMPQTVIVVLALSFTGHLIRLRTYMLGFIITALVTIAISAVLPAEGMWGFYKLTSASYSNILPAVNGTYLATFNGLRDGTFRLLMATGSDGIITFPSLHAALGLLLTAALWPLPILRWPALCLNAVMIVSTPIDGGHYFVDVLAGLAIAWTSFVVAQTIARDAHETARCGVGAGIGLVPDN